MAGTELGSSMDSLGTKEVGVKVERLNGPGIPRGTLTLPSTAFLVTPLRGQGQPLPVTPPTNRRPSGIMAT